MHKNRTLRPITRIYMVGSHATGKTTLARFVHERYGVPMIAEVARGVLAEMEAQLESLRADIDLVNRYQAKVFLRQIESEREVQGPFVSDRAFCNLAYAAHHSTILAEVFRDQRLAEYMTTVREGIVFFLRPHRELIRSDGVRAGLEWEEVVRIDGIVKCLLEMFDVPYIPVESLSMQERVRLVDRVIQLGGLHPVHQPRRYLRTTATEPSGVIQPPVANGDPGPGHHGEHIYARQAREQQLREQQIRERHEHQWLSPELPEPGQPHS